MCKTASARLGEAIECIRAQHPYEIPEIVASDIGAGFEPYLAWIVAETQDPRRRPALVDGEMAATDASTVNRRARSPPARLRSARTPGSERRSPTASVNASTSPGAKERAASPATSTCGPILRRDHRPAARERFEHR